ncbi:MAG: B12-binding domain-containing radical SAM protein [Planctomycetes bacterium]|nr:B12-binding domain-containing radical SAM protein [Planctomycetota bacterium]
MKIMITTTPNSERPSFFPPIGALSVMNYARKRTPHEFKFYNIDYFRHSYLETLSKILAYRPDIFAISAVVSTSYSYTKRITRDVKARLPETLIIIGGNLCTSAEILLKRASTDLCVLGEGEKVFYNIVLRAETTRCASDFHDITGLMLLGQKGELINTGYETPLPANEIWDVDWTDLETDGTIYHYFPLLKERSDYKRKFIAANKNYHYNADNAAARLGHLTIAKGCVARCTFCHRWNKGIRHIPMDEVMRRLEHLYDKYNVRYFNMIAESFGTDKRWLAEFLDKIAKYKILWGAGGVRTSVVTPKLIEQMKDTGCSSLVYGNETGSSKMLEVMEKRVALEDNYNASQWTVEANLGNIVQLVIGMPGESPETIRETIEYCKFATSLSPEQDPRQISINYAQALPGTPLYEYARIQGFLGEQGLDTEEEYLLKISDREAADPQTFINFTDFSRVMVLSWNLLIRIETRFNYFAKFGADHYYDLLARDGNQISKMYGWALSRIKRSGKPGIVFFLYLLARLSVSELPVWYPKLFFRIKSLAPLLALIQTARQFGFSEGILLIRDFIKHKKDKHLQRPFAYVSLRKIVDRDKKSRNITDDPMMSPLRRGR